MTQLVPAQADIIPAGRRRTARDAAAARESQQRTAAGLQATKPQAPAARRDAQPPAAKSPSTDGKVDPLLQLAERAISRTSLRYLDADQHTPWQIMHGMVALRGDFELTRGNDKINCIEFLSDAPTFRGEAWWQVTKHGGRAHPFSVPYAFEGHPNQFLALLSMSNLPLTHEFRVDESQTVTMADMIANAKMTVNTREEITWTLWFLTHYLDIDEEWTNSVGEPWSVEELVRVQTKAPVINTACGGCHGLFAIAYARNAYLQKHGRLRGVYFQAEQKIGKHIELARSMQNYDGSFSTEFFKGTGHSRDFNERLKASGHMLEWLMMALPEDRLNEAWVRKAVASISTDLIHNASQPAECGPLYHALNSLIMYRDRARGPQTPVEESLELAETQTPEVSTPAELPIVQPEAFTGSQSSDASTVPSVDSERTNAAPSVDTSEPTLSLNRKLTPGDELARRAAERLARIVLDAEPGRATIADRPEPPSLLRAPSLPATRMATEPSHRVIR